MNVSVIVPAYNAEKYIKKCLDSIIAQTFRQFELIIVDDGSTDRTGEIADEYAGRYPNVRVIHKKNEGATCARIAGISRSVYEYISLIDADDWVDMDFLQSLVELMRCNQADVVISACIQEREDDSKTQINNIKAGVYSKERLELEFYPEMFHPARFYQFGIQPYLWNKLFKKDLLLECCQNVDRDIYDGEDVAIVYPYLLKSEKAVVCSEAKYHYRIHADSVTAKKGDKYYENVAKLYLYLRQEFERTQYASVMMPQLDQYMRMMVWQKSPESFIETERHVFPFDKVPTGAKIVLYGAGRVGRRFYRQVKKINYCDIVAWVDKNKKGEILEDERLAGLDDIEGMQYDYMVIAIANEDLKETIQEELPAEIKSQHMII